MELKRVGVFRDVTCRYCGDDCMVTLPNGEIDACPVCTRRAEADFAGHEIKERGICPPCGDIADVG